MKAKIIQLPIAKSDLKKQLEWMLENENLIKDIVIGYTLQDAPVDDDLSIFTFWLTTNYPITAIGITRLIERHIEDSLSYE
jgi:hypothetical protein